MSLGRAMWLARVARKNPRRIPIANFSKSVEIRVIRVRTRDRAPSILDNAAINGLQTKHIIHAVAHYYNLPVAVMVGYADRKRFSKIRQIAMYLAKTLTRESAEMIGRYFGHRDHSTILHGQYRTARLIIEDEGVRSDVNKLTHALRAGHENSLAALGGDGCIRSAGSGL